MNVNPTQLVSDGVIVRATWGRRNSCAHAGLCDRLGFEAHEGHPDYVGNNASYSFNSGIRTRVADGLY